MGSPDSATSYHTAVDGVNSPLTPIGTGQPTPSSEDGEASPPKIPYRSASKLPFELQAQCQIYLEEQLYSNALTLLTSLLTQGNAYPSPREPAYIPPRRFLRLASTFLIHPQHTTRASSAERLEVSSQSYFLLRHVLEIVGPINANLAQTFVFEQASFGRRGGRKDEGVHSDDTGSEDGSESGSVNAKLAREGSVWRRAQDFWHVVGWAFNCSVDDPKRWAYWKVWLEYMVDVLERDWDDREALDEQRPAAEDGDDKDYQSSLTDSLLFRWLNLGSGRSPNLKRIVKAVFADGEPDARRQYPEVFENETKERKVVNPLKRKRDLKVDIEKDNYGDWANEESDEVEDGQPDGDGDGDTPMTDAPDVPISEPMGGEETMILRRRLMTLLSKAADRFPDDFVGTEVLYRTFLDLILRLPIPKFSMFITPNSTPHFPTQSLSTLTQVILRCLIQNTAPGDHGLEMNQDKLEISLLPFSAETSSLEDNVKVSLMLECLLRICITEFAFEPTKVFADAITTGIEARNAKVGSDRKKGKSASRNYEDREMRKLLDQSSQRLSISRMMVLKMEQRKGRKSATG